MATRFAEDVIFQGVVTFAGGINTKLDRSQLRQETLAVYPIPLHEFRVWDAVQTVLPGTAANDDLAYVGNTFGTGSPTLQGVDAGGTTETQRARVQVALPPEYVAGESVTIRVSAAMNTTPSDTTATVDVEAYLIDRDGSLGSSGSDLVTTSAQSINSTTFADQDFALTTSSLSPGDLLDIRITTAVTDSGDAGVMFAEIGAVELLCDIRG